MCNIYMSELIYPQHCNVSFAKNTVLKTDQIYSTIGYSKMSLQMTAIGRPHGQRHGSAKLSQKFLAIKSKSQ